MVRALPYIVPLALALFALIDLSRSSSVERAEIHPAAWVAIIVLLPVIGPIAWIAVSRTRSAAARNASGGTTPPRPVPGRPGPRPRRTGPVAPDDDPDFLWRLEQQQRRRRHTEGAPGTSGTSDEQPGTGDTAESGESTGDQPPPDEGTGPAR